jgi:hypothetical protein
VGIVGVSAHVSDAEPLSPGKGARELEGSPSVDREGGDCEGGEDSDGDGISDACEQALAERFAPVVYHSSDESNLPTQVDAFLSLTQLDTHDDLCRAMGRPSALVHPTEGELLGQVFADCEGNLVTSDGTRSAEKHRTFFLADVAEDARKGSRDTRDWTTYFHAYPNDLGGVTIQYWRFYAYNDAANDHGGDWEGLHVVLDRAATHADLEVRSIRLLTHDELTQPPLGRFQFEGTHVRVFSEGGGHATRFSGGAIGARGCESGPSRLGLRCTVDPERPGTFIRQETWTGGRVTGIVEGEGGRLVNLGSKVAPMNGLIFVRYSGLWGSPGVFYGTSGFWGPAFNETSMRADGFVSAWCEGMKNPSREECYPASLSR